MVTEDKIIDQGILRFRLGTVMVWLGIFTWVPFLFLRVIGEKPSFLLFLPFHLLGVIGGARIRSEARKELGMTPPKKNFLRMIGHGLLFIGILVWAPFLYLKLVVGQPVEVLDYLPFHLMGVVGGISLQILSYGIERYRRRKA